MRTCTHMLMILAAAAFHTLHAQVLIDHALILNGATAGDRRVQGLSDADSEEAALNAGSMQRGAFAYAVAIGDDDWTINLDPVPAPLTAGTRLLVKAPADNSGPVTITVNSLGTYYVVKHGSQPLMAGDLVMGEVASLLFDGTFFQLISARRMERRPCPSGFAQVNELYCIEIAEHDSAEWRLAALTCGGLNARLCTWGEWYAACTKAGTLGLQNMNGNWEWTNDAGNADENVRVVGTGSCTQAGVTNGYTFARNYRCCFRR